MIQRKKKKDLLFFCDTNKESKEFLLCCVWFFLSAILISNTLFVFLVAVPTEDSTESLWSMRDPSGGNWDNSDTCVKGRFW